MSARAEALASEVERRVRTRRACARAKVEGTRADLERSTPDGYRIAVTYRPSLRAPLVAVLEVSHAGRMLERVDVVASRGWDAFCHPCAVAPAYARALAQVQQ